MDPDKSRDNPLDKKESNTPSLITPTNSEISLNNLLTDAATETNQIDRLLSVLLTHRFDLLRSNVPFCSPNFLQLHWRYCGPTFQVYYMYHILKIQPTHCENRSGGYVIWKNVDLPLFGLVEQIIITDYGTIGLVPSIHAKYFTMVIKRKLSIPQIDLIENHGKFAGIRYVYEKELIILTGACLNHCIAILTAIEFFRDSYRLGNSLLIAFLDQGSDFLTCLSGLFNLVNSELYHKEMENKETGRCFHQMGFPILYHLLEYTRTSGPTPSPEGIFEFSRTRNT